MEVKKEKDFDKIKVISSEDEKLKIFGELLSNKSSRDIIRLLMNEEHYANEIANKLNLRPNLVIHHLKKLEELGLLEITNKKIIKKGNEHRYFKINPSLFITPNHSKEEIEKKGIFQKIFRDGIKFVAIGIAAIISYIVTQPRKEIVDSYIVSDEELDISDFTTDPLNENLIYVSTEISISDLYTQIITVIIVISVGLFLIFYPKKRKKVSID